MIIFITEQPFSFNLNGAAALSSSHLRLLAKKFPQRQIKVIFLNENTVFWKENPDFKCSNITLSEIEIPNTLLRFAPLNFKSIKLLFSPEIKKLIKNLFTIDSKTRNGLLELDQILKKESSSSIIWCEHIMPVLYLFLLLPEKEILEKVLYSHHDFFYKILQTKKLAQSPRHQIRNFIIKKLELLVFKKIPYFVSGSKFEMNEIKKLAPRAESVQFLPCFYPLITGRDTKNIPSFTKIYHLGTVEAAANKIGLQFFFKKVFPMIEGLPFRLEFLGNVKDYITHEFPQYKDHPKITYHGFVKNLNEKIENGMIHIIPYSGMTGTRTRIAAITRFNPALLAFQNAQDSYPVLVSNENCILAKSDEDFVTQLKNLILDDHLRRKISVNIASDMEIFENRLMDEIIIKD
jgi:hypothetical protein